MSGLRIFVSHSHVDNNFCLRLVRDLRRMVRDKDAVWMDTYGLQAGEAWWPKIEREIADRPIFIVILSPDAMKSKWVRDEINIAWSQKNSALGKVIVPVIHKDCELPPALATIQAVSFASPRQYRDALQGLRHALGMPKLASSRRHITLTSAVEDGPRGAELAALAVHSSQGAEALRNPITNLDPVERSMSSKLSVPPTPEKQAALTSPEELVTQDEFESIREHVKAADLLDWVAQIGMDDEDVWINVGETLRKAKKRKEALLAVGFAIALNPQDASAWTLRGQLLDDLGRHEEALAAFTLVTVLDPDDSFAWGMKGWSHAVLGDFEDALAAYERTLEIDPDDPFTTVEKAEMLMALRRYTEAYDAAKRASELDPKLNEAWKIRGMALEYLESEARNRALGN